MIAADAATSGGGSCGICALATGLGDKAVSLHRTSACCAKEQLDAVGRALRGADRRRACACWKRSAPR